MQTMITAHSGCEGTEDNSIAHIQCALCSGVEAFEIDVHPGPDGQFYLSHDPADSENCVQLSTAFSMLRGSKLKINCDLKAHGIEARVLEMASAWGVGDQLIFSGSVTPEAMAIPEIRKRTFWNLEEAVPALYDRYQQGQPPTAEDLQTALQVFRKAGASVMNLYYKCCTPELLEACRSAGILVSAWTVNETDEAQRLLDAGIYNLTTRRPGMVRQLRESLN